MKSFSDTLPVRDSVARKREESLQKVQGGSAAGPIRDIVRSQTPSSQRYQTLSQELQLLGNYNRIKFVAGAYDFNEHYASYQLPPGLFNTTFGAGGAFFTQSTSLFQLKGSNDSKALFGQVSYTPPILSDKLELTGGLRYTADTKAWKQSLPTTSIRSFNHTFYNLSGEAGRSTG